MRLTNKTSLNKEEMQSYLSIQAQQTAAVQNMATLNSISCEFRCTGYKFWSIYSKLFCLLQSSGMSSMGCIQDIAE